MLNQQTLNELILNAADEGIFGLDLDGKHTFVNPTASRLLGFEVEDLLGQPSHPLWHHTKNNGHPYPAKECPIYGAYKDGRVHHGDDEVFWRKDGTSFPAEYSSTPIFDEAKKLVGAVVTFRDISARREAEETIADLRRQNEFILQSAGEGIFGLDLHGCHTFVNPAAATMLGYNIEELLGHPSHTLWHHTKENGSPYPQEDCPIYGAYKDGLVHMGEDELFWRKDGTSFSAQYCSTPMRNEQGQLLGAVVTFQDITERKRQAAQLLEAAKMAEITRVMGNAGHDIKNMLMPVLTGANILSDELQEVFPQLIASENEGIRKNEQNCVEVIRMIENNARRIQDRVREIADAVKGVTSRPYFASSDIGKIAEGVLKALHVSAQEKGVALHVRGMKKLPLIHVDEKRLFTALYNLVGNAIPVVPQGGTITISGSVNIVKDTLELTIKDTGKGMPPEVRERLFTDNAISTKAGGTGLGSKIIKDAIDQHQGSITVESEEGVGTSFHITLPMNGLQTSKQREDSQSEHALQESMVEQ